MADDHSGEDEVLADFGVDLELDESGFEPGLELDRSGFDSEPEPEPPPAAAPPLAQPDPNAAYRAGPKPIGPKPIGPKPIGPKPIGQAPPRQRGPRPTDDGGSKLSPKAVRALAIGAAILVVSLLAMTMFSESDEGGAPSDPVPQQALEDGERAFHQGKWVEALEAFKRLRRFPTSDEAKEVRDRGLQETAIREIMEAEPSSTTISRLERLAELFPERPEVRDRLGEVRKALSSGARGPVPGEEPDGADLGMAD